MRTVLKAAFALVCEATWQSCRVHRIFDALGHVSSRQHAVAAAIRQAFYQPDRGHVAETFRKVAEQLRPC